MSWMTIWCRTQSSLCQRRAFTFLCFRVGGVWSKATLSYEEIL
jgi:hypothetical protein